MLLLGWGMPLVGWISVIVVGVAVVTIAVYLIMIALILMEVVGRLNRVLRGVKASADAASPVGAVAGSINADLEAAAAALGASLPPDISAHQPDETRPRTIYT